MKIEVSLQEALTNGNTVLMTEAIKLPEHAREEIAKINAIPSPVERIKKLGECLYACKEDLTDPLRELVAQCFNLREEYGWLPSEELDRAKLVIKAMRRDSDEKGKWPKVEDDPAVLSEYTDEEIEEELLNEEPETAEEA